MRSTSAICSPILQHRLRRSSAPGRSWRCVAPECRIASSSSSARCPARRAGSSPRRCARRARQQPHHRQRRDALAAAGLADDAERLAGVRPRSSRRRPRARTRVGIEEMRPEIPHAEELLARQRSHMRSRARRGSSMSRNPSPSEIDGKHHDRERTAPGENRPGRVAQIEARARRSCCPSSASRAASRRRGS